MAWWDYPFVEDEYEDDEYDHPYPLTFEITAPEPELLGTLYGPDGEILFELYEEKMPFGFNRG